MQGQENTTLAAHAVFIMLSDRQSLCYVNILFSIQRFKAAPDDDELITYNACFSSAAGF